MEQRLTILNSYRLNAPPEHFARAIDVLARRVEAEGDPGVLSYRFFVHASEGTARGVIDYVNAAAWIGHHDIAMGWPEMSGLHSVASLTDIVFLGAMTSEIQTWIERSTLTARIRCGYAFAGGFQRQSDRGHD